LAFFAASPFCLMPSISAFIACSRDSTLRSRRSACERSSLARESASVTCVSSWATAPEGRTGTSTRNESTASPTAGSCACADAVTAPASSSVTTHERTTDDIVSDSG
jgi:hypothetical protein